MPVNDCLRVLVVAANYWPETSGNAPYVTGLAEHMAAAGYQVTVVTGFAHYPGWKSTSGRRLWKSESRNEVRIRRRWLYVPGRQSALRRGLYEASLSVAGLTASLPRRHDVVIGVSPSLSGGVVAAATAAFTRRPYGLIVQDLVARAASQSGVPGGGKIAGVLERLELRLARSARGTAVVADGFRDYFVGKGVPTSKIVRVRNWSNWHAPDESRAETRSRLGWGADEFVCLHAGNMGHKQGLENLLNTAGVLAGAQARIVLAGDGNRRSVLEEEALSRGLTNVSFLPPQAEGEYEAMLRAADVLLVNQRSSVSDMALASKLTSYFASGVAVIGALAPESETGREILCAGAGELVASDDPEKLGAAILRFATDSSLRDAYGLAGKVYADRYLAPAVALAEIERFIVEIANRTGTRNASVLSDAAPEPVPGGTKR